MLQIETRLRTLALKLFLEGKQWAEHSAQNMPREVEPSLNERDFIRQALRENIRLDGRPFDAFRDLDLTFGEEFGVADVRLGKTR